VWQGLFGGLTVLVRGVKGRGPPHVGKVGVDCALALFSIGACCHHASGKFSRDKRAGACAIIYASWRLA